jgi:DUF917 family protein
MHLEDERLPYLARGCAVLGAGAGGEVELGLRMARHAVDRHGPVEVMSLAELDDGALILPCGLVGSPAIAAERVPSGEECLALRALVEARRGAALTALMPYEIGGVNGLMPVVWAARLGLPLVDADAVGRSFPSLAQLALGLRDVAAETWVVTDGRGNVVTVEATGSAGADRLVRSVARGLGGLCAAAIAGLSGRDTRAGAVDGSLSRAIACGEDADGTGVRLLDGRVGDVVRRVDGVSVHGSATLQGTGAHEGRTLLLELQDEYLLVLEEGQVRAAVPDIVAVLAVPSGRPIPTERLRPGQRVRVVGLPAPERWRSAEGLALAGPEAFGLEIAHAPIATGAAGVPL